MLFFSLFLDSVSSICFKHRVLRFLKALVTGLSVKIAVVLFLLFTFCLFLRPATFFEVDDVGSRKSHRKPQRNKK